MKKLIFWLTVLLLVSSCAGFEVASGYRYYPEYYRYSTYPYYYNYRYDYYGPYYYNYRPYYYYSRPPVIVVPQRPQESNRIQGVPNRRR